MIVILGESGCGKDTVVKKICELYPEYKKIIPYTTRPIRDNETDGFDYYFVSDNEFKENKKLMFKSTYNSWCYGYDSNSFNINTSVVIMTPKNMRRCKNFFKEKTFAVYIDVDRKSRIISSLNRLNKPTDIEINEIFRRSISDIGQFDGIENEIDAYIGNSGYALKPEELAEMIIDFYEIWQEEKRDNNANKI